MNIHHIRGRPANIQFINGMPQITETILEREIENLERHRKQCRDRYRTKRDILKTLRPELFDKRNGLSRRNREAIREFGLPVVQTILQNITEGENTSQA